MLVGLVMNQTIQNGPHTGVIGRSRPALRLPVYYTNSDGTW